MLAGILAMQAPRRAVSKPWRAEPNWRKAGEIVRARPDLRHLPYGGSKSLPPLFYWGRLDFNVGINFLEQWSFSPLGEAGVASGRVGSYVTLPVGTRDLYGGVPVLITAESIRRHFAQHAGVVIGIDGQARYFRMINAELLALLESRAEKLCQQRCGSLELYVWRFAEPDGK
jgi:hypothetical protein